MTKYVLVLLIVQTMYSFHVHVDLIQKPVLWMLQDNIWVQVMLFWNIKAKALAKIWNNSKKPYKER